MQSLKEAKAIAHGQAPASCRNTVARPNVKAVWQQIGPSQSEFVQLMRVSVKTLQNWEQHRRNPTGPAAALLKIVLTAPEVALKTLHVWAEDRSQSARFVVSSQWPHDSYQLPSDYWTYKRQLEPLSTQRKIGYSPIG